MKSNNIFQPTETLKHAKQLLCNYYMELRREIKGSQEPREDVANYSINDIINKIRNSVKNLIESKINELVTQLTTERLEYEHIIDKFQDDIRNHYKLEKQLKLHNKLLEKKIRALINKQKGEKLSLTNVLDENDNEIDDVNRDNDIRKEQEMLILKAENSNLKATLSKYETIIQYADEKEREMIEEFDKEKNMLLKDIALLEKKVLSQKHNKSSVHSNSNYTINIGDICDSNCSLIIKNQKVAKMKKDTQGKKNETSITSNRTINDAIINKFNGKLKSSKGKMSITNKEYSVDLDLHTFEEISSPVSKHNLNYKGLTNLNESLSNKNYFLYTYNKRMNTFSPNKTSTTNTSRQMSKTNTSNNQKTAETKKTSSKIDKMTNYQNINQKNPTINLYKHKKYPITNYLLYKSPESKQGYFGHSLSPREEKNANCSLKK